MTEEEARAKCCRNFRECWSGGFCNPQAAEEVIAELCNNEAKLKRALLVVWNSIDRANHPAAAAVSNALGLNP